MLEIIVKTQKELDAIKPDFDGTIYIEGGEQYTPLELRVNFDDAYIVVRGEAWVKLRESSHAELRESSHAELRGSSHAVLRGSSHAVLRGSSHAVLRGSSHAVLWESSHAVLWESSAVQLFGEAMVSAFSAKEIIAKGYNVISVHKSDRPNINIVMNEDSYLKVTPDFEPTFKEYAKRYPVTVKGKKTILYKAVHKKGDKYVSDYNRAFEYQIGETKTERCDPGQSNSCSYGLHVSHKSWARCYGMSWSDMALLECEVKIEDIVVSKDCDGKVRTSSLKVLRELPESEWYDLA